MKALNVETESMVLSELKPLELLNQTFAELIGAVEQMMESEVAGEDVAFAADECKKALSAPQRIDDVVALMSYYETREAMLRMAVKVAEERARGQKKFVQNLKDSIELYMIESGIAKIEGFAHYLALYKKADQLVIDNKDLIPDEFFDDVPVPATTQKVLNKERLLNALEQKIVIHEVGGKKHVQFREVSGCTMVRDQKRLGVK